MITPPSAHGKEGPPPPHCRSLAGTRSREGFSGSSSSVNNSPRVLAETPAVIFPMQSAVLDVEVLQSRNRSLCQLLVQCATFDKRFLQFGTAFLELELRGRFESNSTITRTKEALIDGSNRVVFNLRFLLNNINQESVTFRLMCYSRYTGEPVLHGYSTVPTETFVLGGSSSARVILVQSAFQPRGMSISPGSYRSSLPSTSRLNYSTPPATHLCLERTPDSATPTLPPRARAQRYGSESSDSEEEEVFERAPLRPGSAKRALRKPFLSDVGSSTSSGEGEDEEEPDKQRGGKNLDVSYHSMACTPKALPKAPKPKKGFSLSSIPRALRAAFRTPKTRKLHLSMDFEEALGRWNHFESVANDKEGFESLRNHMKEEKNEENIDFWKECERLKRNWNDERAQNIYNEFITPDAPREVNLDWDVRKMLAVSLTPESLLAAQRQIGHLIERDPFPRFLKTTTFQNFVQGKAIRI